MKVIIWVSVLFIGSLFNVLLGELTGLRLGTMLLYLLEFYIARKLCEQWETREYYKKHPEQKQSPYSERLSQITALSDPPVDTPSTPAAETTVPQKPGSAAPSPSPYCPNCGTKALPDSVFCHLCGTKLITD